MSGDKKFQPNQVIRWWAFLVVFMSPFDASMVIGKIWENPIPTMNLVMDIIVLLK